MTTEVYNREMSSPRRYYLGMQQGIMQNKPNFLNNQMNITFCLTSDYDQKPPFRQSENKPNSNPISKMPK